MCQNKVRKLGVGGLREVLCMMSIGLTLLVQQKYNSKETLGVQAFTYRRISQCWHPALAYLQ